jgi:pimeloyl-ACP methyl ester carboxylesterase
VSNQLESEKIAYDYMLNHAKEINDKAAIKSLEKFDKNALDFPTQEYIMTTRSLLMNKYRIGIMREDISMTKVITDMLSFEGYTFADKMGFMQGSLFSLVHLWDDVIANNLMESSTSFEVPVYIMHGKYDYQVSYDLAREYVEKINAPQKGFFTFENSAHSPVFEEPKLFVQTIRDIASQD